MRIRTLFATSDRPPLLQSLRERAKVARGNFHRDVGSCTGIEHALLLDVRAECAAGVPVRVASGVAEGRSFAGFDALAGHLLGKPTGKL